MGRRPIPRIPLTALGWLTVVLLLALVVVVALARSGTVATLAFLGIALVLVFAAGGPVFARHPGPTRAPEDLPRLTDD